MGLTREFLGVPGTQEFGVPITVGFGKTGRLERREKFPKGAVGEKRMRQGPLQKEND